MSYFEVPSKKEGYKQNGCGSFFPNGIVLRFIIIISPAHQAAIFIPFEGDVFTVLNIVIVQLLCKPSGDAPLSA